MGGLSCSIRTDKCVYAPGETIPFDLLLRCEAGILDDPIVHPGVWLRTVGDALPLEITGPQGRCRYSGPMPGPPPPGLEPAYVTLTFGDMVGVLSSDERPPRIVPEYWSMNATGEYAIRFHYRRDRVENGHGDPVQRKTAPIAGREGDIASNTIRIRIRDRRD